MISIENLEFRYPHARFELRIDNLRIEAGEKVALIGPSGSGKTTFLNLIAGIRSADRGEVIVAGQRLGSLSSTARRDFRISQMGMVFQQFELVPYLRARDNIRLPFLINRSLTWNAAVDQRMERLVAQTGLGDKLRRFPGQLSQGEQQRVAIARALINAPRLVLADEPTGNLDQANKRRVLELLFEQLAIGRGTLVLVTHDTSLLDGFDRVIDFAEFQAGLSA